MADSANFDANHVPSLMAVSNVDGVTPVKVYADPVTHRLLTSASGGGTGTVTEVDTGVGLTGGPITTTGTVSLDSKLAPMDSLTGNSLKVLRVNAGETAVEYATAGVGTVTSVASADGSITVTNPTTTVDLAVVKSPKLTTARTIGIATGDATSAGSAFDGTANNTNALTLTTVNSNVGSFTNAAITVNGKGLVTAASSGTTSNLTDAGTDGIVVTGGTGAVLGSGTSLAQHVADTTHNGYLSSTDWNTFNGKGAGTVTAVSVATANGLAGSSSGGATPALTLSTTVTGTLQGNGTAISASKVTLTQPATGSTLTIVDGKTLTVNNTMTLAAGADSQTFTFPTASATVAGLATTQTFTGQDKFNNIIDVNNAVTVSSNAGTVPVTFRLNTFTNSSAATMAITMATASAVDGQMTIVRIYDFSGVTQTIGWTNTENSTVSVPLISNGSTTLPLTVGFMYNTQTSKWRCIASA